MLNFVKCGEDAQVESFTFTSILSINNNNILHEFHCNSK